MPPLRLHRLLVAAAVLVPAGLFAAAAVHDRAQVLREGRETVSRSAAVMHEHARKVFETAELALARVDDRVRGLKREEIATPETNAFLARLAAPLEQAVGIWISDADGAVRAGSHPWDASVRFDDRDYFLAQRERDRGTYVSVAYRGRATGRASFAVSRRLFSPDGRFDGVVHIALSPEYFARFYAQAAPDLPHNGALVRADGEVLIREPPREANRRLGPDNPFMRQIAVRPEDGSAVAVSDADGRERMYAYRKVAGYPLYVAFGVETAVLMRRWHEDLVLFGAVAGTASLALLFVSWLALRGMRAERAATARLGAALDELTRETARREAAEGRVHRAQRMEAVGQLTAGIAHDFNNLLTAVLGSLHLLRKRLPPGDERAARLLDTAEQGARRGASLVQRLLAFGRGQALNPEAVDVPGLVQGMLDLLHNSLGARVRVQTCFPSNLAPARVDASQLELALLNLAVNARDAMSSPQAIPRSDVAEGRQGEPSGSTPGGGVLTLAARVERLRSSGEERVGGGQDGELPPGDYVVLAVRDTGEGMDEATLARAVEPFFTTKGVGKGTGLGLSMVHGLAAQSDGRLVLSSRKGVGTTAELWLPRAVEPGGASDAVEVAPASASPPRAIHRVARGRGPQIGRKGFAPVLGLSGVPRWRAPDEAIRPERAATAEAVQRRRPSIAEGRPSGEGGFEAADVAEGGEAPPQAPPCRGTKGPLRGPSLRGIASRSFAVLASSPQAIPRSDVAEGRQGGATPPSATSPSRAKRSFVLRSEPSPEGLGRWAKQALRPRRPIRRGTAEGDGARPSQGGPGQAPEAARARPEPLRRHTVLAVDDDSLVLASTASMLEDLGHVVVEASSGRQALEILRAGARVDLVVTDQAMPGMTGTQLAAELRRLRPGLPVLLATGYAERAELAASGLPLLAKPFGQAELAAVVEGCLDAHPAPDEQVVPFGAR